MRRKSSATEESVDDLKQKVLTGFGWTATAQIIKQVLQFAVFVSLARILTPADFGLVGMIMVFTGFASLFSELGFGAALIQRKNLNERHYSSVFWLNLFAGIVITGFIMAISPLIAAFYNEPMLAPLTRVIALNFSIGSFAVVQSAILNRMMDFRSLALVQILTIIMSGASAILLALTGFGVWSLVWQMLVGSSITAAALWWLTGWRPRLLIDRAALSELVGFSSNLLGFNVVNYWVRNCDNLLVGRFLGTAPLGIYSRAYGLMGLPVTQITNVLGQVMFPALSRVQNDKVRVKDIYLRLVAMIALITFPVMMGLVIVAEHFVSAVLGPKWTAVTPVLRIFSLLGMVQSIGSTVGLIYQSQGRTDWMFRWGVGAGALLILSIIFGIWIGTIESVAVCYTITSGIILLYPSFAIPGKLVNMTFWEVLRSVAGICFCAGVMAGSLWILDLLLPKAWGHWAHLLIEMPFGILVYGLLIHIFKITAYEEIRKLLSKHIKTGINYPPASCEVSKT